MPYADPEKRRDFQREYKRKWRAEKQTRKSPCLNCPRWGRPDWENICAPACDLRQEYANEVAQYNLPEARKMVTGEEKERREMGEIMPMKSPMKPPIPTETPMLLPFSPMILATGESVIEAIELLLEEKPAGVRKADVYHLMCSRNAPIKENGIINPLYSLICKTMDRLVEDRVLIKNEFEGLFTIQPPVEPIITPDQPVTTPLSMTLFAVDKRRRLIRQLDREGKSVEEIVDITKVSRSTVNKVLHKTKTKPKPKSAVVREAKVAPPVVSIPLAEPKRKSLRGTAAEYKERVIRVKGLHEDGKTTEEIKAEIGCSATTVNRIVEKSHKGSPPLPKGRGNYGPRKYPPPVGVAGAAPTVVTEHPVQKRPVGRPRTHLVIPGAKRSVGRPRKEIIPELPKKGFWAWIMRIAKRMMEKQSQRRAQKVAKMAPEKVCPHCGEVI